MEAERRPAKSGLRPAAEADWSQSQIRQATWWARRATMNGNLSVAELDDRIAILRDNLRQLVEQAAAASGSQNEERIADRITQQTEELDKLILERDSRAKR
jgi:predicted RNA-binding protein